MSVLLIACLIAVGIQIIYLIIYLFPFSRTEVREAQIPHSVSVIVCAHDEEHNLRKLIPLLLAQDHPSFEVIIVEDRSNDGTYDYLLSATQLDNRLKMVRVTNKPEYINGKKFGLTLGIRAASNEWLLFTDADCRPTSNQWIKRMTETYTEQTQLVLGFSPYHKEPGLLNAFIRFESILTGIQAMGLALLGKPYMGLGRNLAYTKSLFLKNKGFNNYLGVVGGDDDLFVNLHSTKSNTVVCLGDDAVTISIPKKSWLEFFDQKLRHLHAGKHYKLIDKLILGTWMVSWLITWFIVFPSMFFFKPMWPLVTAFFLRLALLVRLIQVASYRLSSPFEIWKTPILDFIFPFYYLVTGLRALVVKRIRWKN